MASIKNLKKDINNVLGDIIEQVYVWERKAPKESLEEGEKIIEEAIASFDAFIERIHESGVAEKSKHFNAIKKDLELKANELVDKINILNKN